METDYERDLTIDPDALDTEWLVQPSLFMKYAEACADARLVMDREKEALDVIRAGVDNDVRSNPAAYGVDKLTETRVAGLVIQSTPYKEATDRYLQAKHDFEVLSATVRAFDNRKAALENLVRLQGQGYFAGPQVPRDLKEGYKQRMEEMREATKGIAKGRIKERLGRREAV